MFAADDAHLNEILTTLLTGLGRELPLPPERAARWIQRLIDAAYQASGDPDFDVSVEAAELRRLVGWLAGA